MQIFGFMSECSSLRKLETPRLPESQRKHIILIENNDNSEENRKNISAKEISEMDKKTGITEREVSTAKDETEEVLDKEDMHR